MKASVNKIINMSFIDGPGCRISIFLQGCNMECIYCHNPETQNICLSCKECIDVCKAGAFTFEGKIKYDKSKCINCDECIGVCKKFASPKITYYDTTELFNYINKYKNLIDGITFSGGECTIYSDFIVEFADIIHEKTNLNVFVDTNGNVKEKDIDKLIENVDGFMFDLKAFKGDTHIKVTGIENNIVFNNINKCAKTEKLYEIRTVLIENINDDWETFIDEVEYIKNLNGYTKFKLIPFRQYGVKGELSNFRDYPKEKYMKYHEKAKEVLKERMINPII
ncbi:YjjW family glycine radical enzyme activase [Paraclostridium bifermentans]|uniref:YjjW family glycine radical enzyme activase n=1 Tax=Paraclostridium bifermentans TaxID=1490 RepID=A0ABY8R1S6_PARBF|nr:YjjW family glycine radical enzyme activase [Paraclostridium bifermentans]